VTATATKTAPASAPAERAAESTKRIETLRREMAEVQSGIQDAADRGDRSAVGKLLDRRLELKVAIYVEQRLLLIANVGVAEAMVAEGEARMAEARDRAEEARLAAERVDNAAREKRMAELEAGTLMKWQYLDALNSDTFDADQARQRTAHAAAAARDALMEPTFALQRA
jgi:hypothetical protein